MITQLDSQQSVLLQHAYEAARLRVEESLTVAEIAGRMAVSESSVFRFLRVAKDQGMVKQHVVPPSALVSNSVIEPSDLQALEGSLENALKLREVTLVPIPPGFAGVHEFNCVYDERLTRILGDAGSRQLLASLRPGDVLGVGSGRSIYFTAVSTALQDRHQNGRGLCVVSMAGGQSIYPFAEGHTSVVSADVCTSLLGRALSARTIPRDQPAYKSLGSQLRFSWNIDDSGGFTHRPNIAVVGVGTVAKDFFNCFRQSRFELDPAGRALSEQIEGEADAIVDTLKSARIKPWHLAYFPVGDMLGVPFVVDPPAAVREVVSQERLRTLQERVLTMADRVCAATPEHLSKIDQVLIVAGGARKSFPVFHLIHRLLESSTNPWRHSLVTDYWTGRALLTLCEEHSVDADCIGCHGSGIAGLSTP